MCRIDLENIFLQSHEACKWHILFHFTKFLTCSTTCIGCLLKYNINSTNLSLISKALYLDRYIVRFVYVTCSFIFLFATLSIMLHLLVHFRHQPAPNQNLKMKILWFQTYKQDIDGLTICEPITAGCLTSPELKFQSTVGLPQFCYHVHRFSSYGLPTVYQVGYTLSCSCRTIYNIFGYLGRLDFSRLLKAPVWSIKLKFIVCLCIKGVV